MKLPGKVALVTGAARGQGRAHAVRLAEEGADVIMVDICAQISTVPYPMSTAEDLAETVCLVNGTGRRAVSFEVDVRNGPALAAAIDAGVEELGRLDIVAANAGIVGPYKDTELFEYDEWSNMIDVNLNGVFNTVKSAVPHLKRQGEGGSIVITSSAAGLHGAISLANYSTAKHGIVGLMRTLAKELAPASIRVNSLHPTQVNTLMIHNRETYQRFLPGNPDPSFDEFAAASQAINAMPVSWVEVSDVTNALLFLVSDEGRFITGVTLPIDAGLLLL